MSSGASDLDIRRERAARNEALFREVNERIEELSSRFLDDEPRRFLCECHDPDCRGVISIPHQEYVQIRRDPTEFVVVPGHEDAQVEQIVDATDRWVVVRKVGAGALVAKRLAPPN
jgi:hypothetical protein